MIDLILCGGRIWLGLESGSKLTWFSCRGACKIYLFLEQGSTLTGLQCWGRNELSFVWGIEVDSVLVWGPKLTSFLCGCQNWPCFFYAGRKLLVFSVSIEIRLFFVMVVEIDLISVWGIELDLISVSGWNRFGSCEGGRNWLVTCMRAENPLFLGWAWKFACILRGWS